MVVIRRKVEGRPPTPWQLRTVLGDLREHNLVHFKGTTDELEVDDALQLVEYAAGYMRAEGLHDATRLALRVVAPSLTPRFREALSQWAMLARTELPGVHEGALGAIALRVIETSLACDLPHEELLMLFSPRFLAERRVRAPVDERERHLYNRLYRSIEQLARTPEAAMTKDVALVQKHFEEDLADIVPLTNLSIVLSKLTPAQRLAGLDPAQRLAGLDPAHAVLALPDEALSGLSERYLATLPDDVQAQVRARLGR